ncbi:MAG TPA: hypothetical protein VMG31_14420 [Verrucomicrobiae bacterium]|nr:hypothetical protein [Verrucomicrobiae bacterium]
MNQDGELTQKDLYSVAHVTRNLEIGLFWERSNYFLVLNTALAVGFFNVKERLYSAGLAAMGVLVSFFWYKVNLGSKYWQSRWEQRLKIVENKLAPDAKLFGADWSVIDADVQDSLVSGKPRLFKHFVDKQIKKKPSVTNYMIMLSLVFMLGWFLLIVKQVAFPTSPSHDPHCPSCYQHPA